MFGFFKQCFFTGLAFLLTLTSVNLLSCISMNNQDFKVRNQIVNVNSLLVLIQINSVVVATISIFHIPYANVCSWYC